LAGGLTVLAVGEFVFFFFSVILYRGGAGGSPPGGLGAGQNKKTGATGGQEVGDFGKFPEWELRPAPKQGKKTGRGGVRGGMVFSWGGPQGQ